MRNIHNLDLLRSLAVSFVLVDHTTWALGHHTFWHRDTGLVGVFGVYLFFVHTALVLMGSMERQPRVLNFYIRRVFRIYPLAITAILAGLFIPVWNGWSVWVPRHFTGSTILSNLVLLQDLAQRQNIVGVMWTLTIEVQMYVMLPALFFLAEREKKVWPLVILWALAVAVNHVYFRGPAVIFPNVIPNFIPGVIAYLIFLKRRPHLLPAWAFGVFVLAMLMVYLVRPGSSLSWIVSLALGFGIPFFRQISLPWLVKLSQQVAQYSYGIYLWHSFGIKLGFRYFTNPWTQVGAELAITVVLSVMSYKLIEHPLDNYGKLIASRYDSVRAHEPSLVLTKAGTGTALNFESSTLSGTD